MSELREIRMVWINPDGAGVGDAVVWQAELARWAGVLAAGRGDVLKREEAGDGRGVDGVYRAMLTINGRSREVVIKCRVLRGLDDRLKARVRMGRGDRHRRGAVWLSGHGIETAAVLAQAQGRVADGDGGLSRPVEILVMEYVEGRTLLEMMAAASEGRGDALTVRAQHELARAVGRQLVRFMSSRGYNRDHKPSNLIVASGGMGNEVRARVVVIDTVGIRHGTSAMFSLARKQRGYGGGSPLFAGVIRMGASLVIEPTGCGCRPRRALMMRVMRTVLDEAGLGRGAFMSGYSRRMIWMNIERIVAAHGDPTPKINPLERSERI